MGGGQQVGLLNPNTLDTNGVWWNTVDSSGVDRTNDYNQLALQTGTVTFTQNGNSAIYTASNIQLTPGPSGSCFNYSILPGSQNSPSMHLIQASPSDFIEGQLVSITYTI